MSLSSWLSAHAPAASSAHRPVVTCVRPPLKQSRWRQRWRAKQAVAAGMPIWEFLLARLHAYMETVPQSPRPLPKTVSTADGAIDVADHAPADLYADEPSFRDAAERRGLAQTLRAVEADRARQRDLLVERREQAEGEATRLSARITEIDEQLNRLVQARDEEVARGDSLVPATEHRHPRQRGCPTPPFPSRAIATSVVTGLCLSFEAYAFCLPYWDQTGIDSTNLAGEWARNPLGVISGAGFAVAAMAVLFLFSWVILELCHSVYLREGSVAQRVVKSICAVLLFGVVLLATTGIGSMRRDVGEASSTLHGAMQGMSAGARGNAITFIAITTMLPFGLGFLHLLQKPRQAERLLVAAQRQEWRAQEESRRATRERREELMRPLTEKKMELVRARDAAQKRLDTIKEAIADLERRTDAEIAADEAALRETLAAERRFALAFMNSVIAALEMDRYYFIFHARRQHAELLSPDAPRAPDRSAERAALERAGQSQWPGAAAAEVVG